MTTAPCFIDDPQGGVLRMKDMARLTLIVDEHNQAASQGWQIPPLLLALGGNQSDSHMRFMKNRDLASNGIQMTHPCLIRT